MMQSGLCPLDALYEFGAWFKAVRTLVNLALRVEPKPAITVTIAIERNPALTAYSIAVAAL